MKTLPLSLFAIVGLFVLGCDAEPLPNDDAPDHEFRNTSPFAAEELYLELRDLTDAFPIPEPTQIVEVGTFDPATGSFTGLRGTEAHYDPELGLHIPAFPAVTDIGAVRAVLRFRSTGGGVVTVNGRTHTISSGYVDVDIGRAKSADWSISALGNSYEDELVVTRNGVDGIGAFQLEAWPVGLLYEPPTNETGTNSATFSHLAQHSSSVSIGETSASSGFVDTPTLANRALDLANKVPPVHPVAVFVANIENLIGSVHTKVTEGSSVSSENTLEITTSELLSVSTNADLGPGRGDVIAYLKNPRLAWIMLNGELTVTLIDYESAEYRAASQLRSDLLAVRAGGPAAHTGLTEGSLEGLLELDPFFSGEGSDLPENRFEFSQTIAVGGADVGVSLSHTKTATDRSARTTYTGSITETQGAWLSVVGIGIGSTGQQTTKITQASSTSVSVGETTTSSFQLGATPTESYTVEAYYDRIFGTFALRRPDACPFFDPLHPDGSFCDDPACPCENGTGDCDTDAQCAEGLFCGQDIGAQFGLPATWDVCVDELSCPPFDPGLPNGSFCSADCPCGDGEGDCDSDAQCQDDLFCAHDVGPQFGLPANWDVCVAELECPDYDPARPNAEFCSVSCPCDVGEGDCDSNDECAGFLVCADNVGGQYGLPAHWDMCRSPLVVPTFPTFPTQPSFPSFPG